ncbi:hypothetical protein BC833DRAFT_613173 [Globomyces pollinis-pini]|nr:hypothetical protein BC833DRAFT_613173 [Globomyces pollinis-pini]
MDFTFLIRYGYVDAAMVLLEDGRLDPSANDNDTIYWASSNGYFELVKKLLNDERMDPSGGKIMPSD